MVLTAALAEEDGDDPRVPSARAERADGQWVLSGVKTAVDAAPEADLFLVPCASPDGVLVFLVAPSDAGVRVEPQQLTDFGSAGRVVLSTGASCPTTGCWVVSVTRWRTGWWRGPRWGCARCSPG